MKPTEVRKLRVALGMTQEEFGAQFPVDARTVIRWEGNSSKPSPMAHHKMRHLRSQLDEKAAATSESGEATLEPEAESSSSPVSSPPRRRGVVPSASSVVESTE